MHSKVVSVSLSIGVSVTLKCFTHFEYRDINDTAATFSALWLKLHPSKSILQGVLTFLYISVLSHLGERFAVRLRTALFQSLVQREIAFFDSHKTGELVNRYTL